MGASKPVPARKNLCVDCSGADAGSAGAKTGVGAGVSSGACFGASVGNTGIWMGADFFLSVCNCLSTCTGIFRVSMMGLSA